MNSVPGVMQLLSNLYSSGVASPFSSASFSRCVCGGDDYAGEETTRHGNSECA
jgi:hypothetical protein